jgi:uncharacterized protein (DUF2461 family)
MPEPSVAARLRGAFVAAPDAWAASNASAGTVQDGPMLVRVPKPWPADHPLAEDLRRKSCTTWLPLTKNKVTRPDSASVVRDGAARLAPLVRIVASAANDRG